MFLWGTCHSPQPGRTLLRRRFVRGNFDSVHVLQYSLSAINSFNDTVSCPVKLLCAPFVAANARGFWGLIQAQLRLMGRLPPHVWDPHFPPRRGAGLLVLPSASPTSARPSRTLRSPGTGLQRNSLGDGRASTASRRPLSASLQLPSSSLLPEDSSHATKTAASNIISSLIVNCSGLYSQQYQSKMEMRNCSFLARLWLLPFFFLI